MQADPPPNYTQAADLFDNDLDGVINQRDDCGQTLTGASVNNSGCGDALARDTTVPSIVFFDNDRDQIRADQRHAIDDALARLNAEPKMTITLVGHTSAVASAEYNLALSKRRVDNVKQALLDGGINPQRISSDYRGEMELKFSGDSEQDHRNNRRVEIRYLSQQSTPVMRWHINSVDPQ
ncbi:OmpA family protein [Ferrimonas senticii]|uniref:OmpA family protein n=1 Tax=Ferrimonas senticii TaxID=394566 RepID=UPI000403174F|nr:OmpA family protein [Ferrimonas senticii]